VMVNFRRGIDFLSRFGFHVISPGSCYALSA
jgi:hypothetical protein